VAHLAMSWSTSAVDNTSFAVLRTALQNASKTLAVVAGAGFPGSRRAITKVRRATSASILTVAVEHDADRHGDVPDKEWVELTDDHAANLLVDAIVANHLLRDALALKIRGLESPTPKST